MCSAFMIRLEAPPVKPSDVPTVEAEGAVFYHRALTEADREALKAEGWREVARHPVDRGSALVRLDGCSLTCLRGHSAQTMGRNWSQLERP